MRCTHVTRVPLAVKEDMAFNPVDIRFSVRMESMLEPQALPYLVEEADRGSGAVREPGYVVSHNIAV